MTTTETTLQHLKPTEISTHTRNPRQNAGDVTDLAASITEHGILEPLVVAPWPSTLKGSAAAMKKHLLIAGHRRLAAAKVAKVATVPCILRTDLDTEAKQIEAMLVENLHRSDLTPVEEADAYQTLLDFPGFTQTKLAKDVGQPVSRIRERLKIGKLDTPVKNRLHDGQITIVDALAIGEFADDKKATASLLKSAGTDDFRRTLQAVRNTRDTNAKVAKRLEALKAGGLKIVKSTPAKPARRIDSWDGIELVPSDLRYGSDESKIDAWVLANHLSCEGALAAVTDDYGTQRISFWCTTPKAHPKPKVQKSPAEIKRAKEEAERKATTKQQNAINTPLRRAHLRATLSNVTEDAAKRRLIANLLAHPQYHLVVKQGNVLCDVLDVEAPTVDKGDPAWSQFTEVIAPALNKLSLLGLVVMTDIAICASDEAVLDTLDQWIPTAATEWMQALIDDYGYAASEFELARTGLDTKPADDEREES